MATELWVVVISAIIPLATLIYTLVGVKRKSETEYIDRIERRLEACERDRERLWEIVHKYRSQERNTSK